MGAIDPVYKYMRVDERKKRLKSSLDNKKTKQSTIRIGEEREKGLLFGDSGSE